MATSDARFTTASAFNKIQSYLIDFMKKKKYHQEILAFSKTNWNFDRAVELPRDFKAESLITEAIREEVKGSWIDPLPDDPEVIAIK